jgi:hypothetical protein
VEQDRIEGETVHCRQGDFPERAENPTNRTFPPFLAALKVSMAPFDPKICSSSDIFFRP